MDPDPETGTAARPGPGRADWSHGPLVPPRLCSHARRPRPRPPGGTLRRLVRPRIRPGVGRAGRGKERLGRGLGGPALAVAHLPACGRPAGPDPTGPVPGLAVGHEPRPAPG